MKIGPFELEDVVIDSAVGRTYVALDDRFGRNRWVTVANVAAERRRIALAAIRTDIAKLERHSHESILRPLEAGVWDEQLIVVHDPPAAISLREFLDASVKRGDPMVRLSEVLPCDAVRAAGFIRNLGKVVGACHAQAVFHGLLSPDCVFGQPPGNALLFGAGLSALLTPRRDDAEAAIKPHPSLRRLNPDSFGTVLADAEMADKSRHAVRRSLMHPEATRSPSWPGFVWWIDIVDLIVLGISALFRLFTKF